MAKNILVVLYFVLLVAVVVGVDVLFFRNRVGERLLANIGIVAAFVVVYFLFIRSR